MLGPPVLSLRGSPLSHGVSPWDPLAAGPPPDPQHVSLAGLDPAGGGPRSLCKLGASLPPAPPG